MSQKKIKKKKQVETKNTKKSENKASSKTSVSLSQKKRYVPTQEEQIRELRLCKRDPVYFIENYVMISHPMRGPIPFLLYPFQKKALREFQNNRFNVVLKARQMGVSTLTAAFCAWFLFFFRSKEIIVVATKQDSSTNLLRKTKFALNNLPGWMKFVKYISMRETYIELNNGSRMKAVSSSPEAARSEALSLLVIDEAAIIPNAEKIFTAAVPTIAAGGSCIAISTPFGASGWFFETWQKADPDNRQNNFNRILIEWHEHPDRDDTWFATETANMSLTAVAQEYLCSFEMSGETVFAATDIEWYKGIIVEPNWRLEPEEKLWIWKDVVEGKQYIIGADVARGDSTDFSAFFIIEAEKNEVVAEYKAQEDPKAFALRLDNAGRQYNSALLICEANNIGWAVLSYLLDFDYPNLYYSHKTSKEYVSAVDAVFYDNTSVIPGIMTTPASRPLLIEGLEEQLRTKSIKSHSSRFTKEMDTFIWKNHKPQAADHCNDDLIMAMALAQWARTRIYVKDSVGKEKTQTNLIFTSRTRISTQLPEHDDPENLRFNIFKDINFLSREANLKRRKTKKEIDKYRWLYKG